MIEAVHTSETSVNLNVNTRRYIPEYSKLQAVSSSASQFQLTVVEMTMTLPHNPVIASTTRKSSEYFQLNT
jgi:hypothetical protein